MCESTITMLPFSGVTFFVVELFRFRLFAFIESAALPSIDLRFPPVISTCPLHANSACGKERRTLIGPW